MKLLFEKFIIALDQYAQDSSFGAKSWFLQNTSLTQAKLELAGELDKYFRDLIPSLDDNEVSFDQAIGKIEEIKTRVEKQRLLWRKPEGALDHLLVWMSECLKMAKMQSMLPLDDIIAGKDLSGVQRFIKRELDQFIVLLKGFQPVSDEQQKLEVWECNDRKVLYPVKAGWDESTLTQNKIKLIAEQVDSVKNATLVQLRNQEKDQEKYTLHYMTVSQLSDISPVLAPLCQSLTKTFGLKPWPLKKEKPAAAQEVDQEFGYEIIISAEDSKEEPEQNPVKSDEISVIQEQLSTFPPKTGIIFSNFSSNISSNNMSTNNSKANAIPVAAVDDRKKPKNGKR